MNRSAFLFVLLLIPLALPAQVYRCDTSEGTVYSQMPCAENAERLPEFDPHEVETAEAAAAGQPGGEGDPQVEERRPSAMENFILTLEKQREQQFQTLDANIRYIRDQLKIEGDNAPNEATRRKLEGELTALNSERDSISEQYAALISEAVARTETGHANP